MEFDCKLSSMPDFSSLDASGICCYPVEEKDLNRAILRGNISGVEAYPIASKVQEVAVNILPEEGEGSVANITDPRIIQQVDMSRVRVEDPLNVGLPLANITDPRIFRQVDMSRVRVEDPFKRRNPPINKNRVSRAKLPIGQSPIKPIQDLSRVAEGMKETRFSQRLKK
ncbi:MAG: hypothetical protein ACQEP8_05265 [Chlamydiota bacterium]